MKKGGSSSSVLWPPEEGGNENGNRLRSKQTGPVGTWTSCRPYNLISSLLSPVPENTYKRSLSGMAFEDAKSALLSTTGGLLVPTATETTWHSIPLAFAVLPAIAGTIFTNGEGVMTDVLLLSLVAIFLHWFVKFPWEWYQDSRQVRLDLESPNVAFEERGERKQDLETSDATDKGINRDSSEHLRRREAVDELQRNETQALIFCFLGPLAGGYLMYCIRSQLSRPSGGLISNFNLSVFVLAAELRPLAEVVRLMRDRNTYLQQMARQPPPSQVEILEAKVESLQIELKELVSLTTKAIERDADVDALNRAVRRYEKKETLHCIQTEARLVDMDSRLNDVLTLAAAATARHSQQTLSLMLFEWACGMLVIPFSIAWKMVTVPKDVVARIGELSKGLKAGAPRLLLKQGNSPNGKKKEKPRMASRGVVRGRV